MCCAYSVKSALSPSCLRRCLSTWVLRACCDWQLPHKEFWLEVRSLVADGISYAHARATSGNGAYAKIEDNSSQDGGVATSEASKPASVTQTIEPVVASAGGGASLGEVRDETVHSSQQKIKVVTTSATSSKKQAEVENAESEDDEELVE